MKLYLSGPITGVKNYKRQFSKAISKLKEHTCMNPAVLPPGFDYDDYMHVCYAMIEVCEGIYMLKGWDKSKGAKLELDYAIKLGKVVYYEE